MNFNQIQVGDLNDCPSFTTTSASGYDNFSEMENYNYGWVCPKCGRVYSPSTIMCAYCGDSNVMPQTTVSDKTFFDDWYIYHITNPLKEPEIHLDKDWKNKEFYVDYIKPNVMY